MNNAPNVVERRRMLLDSLWHDSKLELGTNRLITYEYDDNGNRSGVTRCVIGHALHLAGESDTDVLIEGYARFRALFDVDNLQIAQIDYRNDQAPAHNRREMLATMLSNMWGMI